MLNTCELQSTLAAANNSSSHHCSAAITTIMAFSALVQGAVLRKARKSPRPSPRLDRRTFDFIVVGAGAGGAVVAHRLSCQKYTVLLLEAGGEEPGETEEAGTHGFLVGSSIDWNYTTEPEPHNCGGKGCRYPRGKVLGGSTAINSMIFVRGNPRDYDAWEAAGNEGWGWRDVLPYLKRFEDNRDQLFSADHENHSTGGPQSVQRMPTADINAKLIFDAFGELGYPQTLTGGSGDFEHRRGVFVSQFFNRDGKRQSTNQAYLAPIRKTRAKYLRVVTGARVTRVILDERRVARGVQFMDDASNGKGHVFSVFARKEVILSAGTIQTPQLLLLSGVGPKAVLDMVGIPQVLELPVGQNLQDHTTGDAFDLVLTKTSTLPDGIEPWVAAQREYNAKQNGPLSTVNSLTIQGFLSSNYTTPEWPDIQLSFLPTIDASGGCVSSLADAPSCAGKPRTRDCIAISFSFCNAITVNGAILRPRSRGNITLHSADPFAAPRININFLDDPHDLSVLVQAYRMAYEVAGTSTLVDNGFKVSTAPLDLCDDYLWGTDEYISCVMRSYGHTNYHPCCTSKMGPDGDPTAVVDSRLRVRGIRNLRVIDTSVMPTITSGNTAAPTIMIGEKGSQMIMDDWPKFDNK